LTRGVGVLIFSGLRGKETMIDYQMKARRIENASKLIEDLSREIIEYNRHCAHYVAFNLSEKEQKAIKLLAKKLRDFRLEKGLESLEI
jgi:hypothetical protein